MRLVQKTSLSQKELALYYSFDNGAKDLSGGDNRGVVEGAEMKSDVSGKSYQFGGNNDYIAIKNLHYNEANSIEQISVYTCVKSTYSGGRISDN